MNRTSTGLCGLPFANTAQIALIIQISIVCGALLVLTNGRLHKLQSTLQPKVFERFLARTPKPCGLQGEKDKVKRSEKNGCRAIEARFIKVQQFDRTQVPKVN